MKRNIINISNVEPSAHLQLTGHKIAIACFGWCFFIPKKRQHHALQSLYNTWTLISWTPFEASSAVVRRETLVYSARETTTNGGENDTSWEPFASFFLFLSLSLFYSQCLSGRLCAQCNGSFLKSLFAALLASNAFSVLFNNNDGVLIF